MFNSNIWHNSASLRDILLRNLSDLDIDLSRSSVRSNVIAQMDFAYMLPIKVNSNTWSNLAPLQHISLQNLDDLDFDLSRSLKAKCDGIIGLTSLSLSLSLSR